MHIGARNSINPLLRLLRNSLLMLKRAVPIFFSFIRMQILAEFQFEFALFLRNFPIV